MSDAPLPAISRVCFAATLAAAAASAQQWVPIATQPRYRIGQAMATDPLTSRPLLFGGSSVYNWSAPPTHDADTWRWNGSSWARLDTAAAPPAAGPGLCAALDLARSRVVLFVAAATPAETWEWDGRAWLQRTPANVPPAFQLACAVAYDAFRGRTVLYDTAAGTDTWEWDGSNWTQVVTAHSPGARFGFQLAFDLQRGRTVLFGGDDGSRQHVCFSDTWEYDGVDWVQAAPVLSPPARNEHAMVWDGAQVLLYGGRNGAALMNDTWRYDGLTWTPITTPLPPLQVEPQLAHDSVAGRTLLVTNRDTGTGAVPETWSFDGAQWTQQATPPAPPVREFHGLADDAHGRMLLFGGYNAAVSGLGGSTFSDTWLFDGSRWQPAAPATSPLARASFGIATDTLRQRVVVFGGEDGSQRFGDTWEWDGGNWTLAASSGPSPRSRLAMAFDAVRGVVLLQGGDDGSQLVGDSWTWNGSGWTQVPAAGGTPGARADHALAFDRARGVVALFGGHDGNGARNDVWQWNGTAWSQLAASAPPAPRQYHDFTYDPDRQRFVLHGGADAQTATDTWEWDGASSWTHVQTGSTVGTATAAGAAWDPVRHRVLQWDGSALWAFTAAPGGSSSYGAGCSPATPPVLVGAGRPFLGNQGFALEVLGAGAPALLFADFQSAQLPLGGCTVLLQSPRLLGLGLPDGAGVARLPLPLAADPALRGLTVYAQAAVLTTVAWVELTQGVRLVLGD